MQKINSLLYGYKKIQGKKSTDGITGKEKAGKGEDTKETNPR
jgi:hypothetical protein